MTSRRAGRPAWWSLAVVAPGSMALLAATVVWVGGHDPRADDVPAPGSGPTAAGSTLTASSGTAPRDDVSLRLDSATSLRLARLQVLVTQAEAQLLQLENQAAVPAQAPSPVQVPPPVPVPPPAPADVAPPAAAVQPPIAPAPAPVAHAATGASGA